MRYTSRFSVAVRSGRPDAGRKWPETVEISGVNAAQDMVSYQWIQTNRDVGRAFAAA